MKKLKNYSDYDALAFATDSHFQEWVLRKEDDAYWQQVMTVYESKREEMVLATELLKSIKFKENLPAVELVENSLQVAREKIEKKPKVFHLGKWWAAAAVLVIMLGAGWYFVNTPAGEKPAIAATEKGQDIAPGGNKAILTLADGSVVVLDSANNGALAEQGGVTVIKLDNGQLSYDGKGGKTSEVVYNTITTPRGGQYQIVLADGSKVWLNAESSLRFPTAFVNKERKVEMTGEGYFEVAHDAAKPFFVQVGEMNVQVLGTSFNVNGYGDEGVFKITLLAGSVIVKAKNEVANLQPAEQALLSNNGQILINKDVNLEEVTAWKNGKFYFDDITLIDLMKMLERWYDVEVIFEDNVKQKRFTGKMYMNSNLSQVLKILEGLDVHFKIEGKNIIVKELKQK